MSIKRGSSTVIVGAAALIAMGIAMAAHSGPNVTAAKGQTPVPSAQTSPARDAARDTPAALESCFQNEMNDKTRHLGAAKVAAGEGYPYVAGLFRACARAEQVHADAHLTAFGWLGGTEAKAVLQKLNLGTTEENLRAAVELETYEANEQYPALVQKARADHQAPAVRSLNFALAAEREHVQLLTAALASLDERPSPRPFYVCPTCGKTVEEVRFEKCPNCFTSAKTFIRVD